MPGAMIALLGLEQGALVVRLALRDNRGDCYAHAANLCEVYYHVARVRDVPTALLALSLLANAGVTAREDLDTGFWSAGA